MPADASIILGTQPVQNPIDSMVKAMTLRDLMQKSQINAQSAESGRLDLARKQQEFGDEQATRDAYKNNVITKDDGTQTVDRAGVLSDLNKQNPMLAAKANANFQQLDIDQLTKQHAIRKEAAFSVPTDPSAPMDQKQSAWSDARQRMIASGIPGADKAPLQYPGDSWMRNAQMQTLTAEEQLAQRKQQIDQSVAQQNAQSEQLKARAAAFEAGMPVSGGAGGVSGGAAVPAKAGAAPALNPPPKMRQKAMEDYNQAIEGSRQRPDSLRSLQDIQSADKVNEAISQAPKGDTNKLNNNQVRLITGELVKMATGGAPTETELESLTPNNVAQKYGGMLQHLTNKSTPANAGEFVKQFQDYANGIAKQGMDRVSARSSEIADRLKPYLGDEQHKLVKDQIANEFSGNITKKIIRLQELRAKAAGGQ